MGHLRRLIRPIIYKKPKTAEEIAFVADKEFKFIEVDVPMPTWIADDIVAAQESPFPPVESIVTAPVLVPGGRCDTSMRSPVSSAKACSSRFQSRLREPLPFGPELAEGLPPPSAVMSRRLAFG